MRNSVLFINFPVLLIYVLYNKKKKRKKENNLYINNHQSVSFEYMCIVYYIILLI